MRTGTFDYWIGGDGASETMQGYIAIARMYNRELTTEEVELNYNTEKAIFGH